MKELEKKYLAAKLDPLNFLTKYNNSRIIQHYISIKPEIRTRLSITINHNNHSIKSKASITIKTREEVIEGGLDREEIIIKITCNQFEELRKTVIPGAEIFKDRYYMPYHCQNEDYLIEYDWFHGVHDGLLLAEVEFKNQEHMKLFIPPKWFLIDVTDDSTFLNRNLALNGMPTKHLLELLSKKIIST
jgi:CYTH domain-containing protein